MAETTETKVEGESFSPQNAYEAMNELFDALPKSKRMDYLGHLNEIGVVLKRLALKANHEWHKGL